MQLSIRVSKGILYETVNKLGEKAVFAVFFVLKSYHMYKPLFETEVKMNFAYIRVSTKEQNESRQTTAIQEYVTQTETPLDAKNIFIEKASGKDFERPIYIDMKKRFRNGDVLIIKELDRLGRDMDAIRREWNYLADGGIDIVVIDTPIINTINRH